MGEVGFVCVSAHGKRGGYCEEVLGLMVEEVVGLLME